MIFSACIFEFHILIRLAIALDGTFLKYSYLGTLFVATSKDGNNRIYSLTFGIGNSKINT